MFHSVDELNEAANAAVANTRYQWGNFAWTTNANGKVAVAEGKVSQLTAHGRKNAQFQAQIGKEGAAAPTDVGFHLLGDAIGCPVNRLNVVPGNGKRFFESGPNLNQSAYSKFETQFRKEVESGKTMEIRVECIYNPGNLTNRPDAFKAMYREEGKTFWTKETFQNIRE